MTQTLSHKEQVMSAMQIIAKETKREISKKDIVFYLDLSSTEIGYSLRELLKDGAIRKSASGKGFVLLK